jgi:hypothetical protein
LTALEGGERERDIQCRRCDSKKAKVHAENIYPHRSPEVSLLEVLDTLLTIGPLLFSDSCPSTVQLEMTMADTEVFGRGIVELWSMNESPEDLSQSELLVFGVCPPSSILETRKRRVLEAGSVSVLR